MKLNKDHKKIVARWVEVQFQSNDNFPERYLEQREEAKSITPKHFKVLKRWRSLPTRWRYIREWLEDHLSETEMSLLQAHVEQELSKPGKEQASND